MTDSSLDPDPIIIAKSYEFVKTSTPFSINFSLGLSFGAIKPIVFSITFYIKLKNPTNNTRVLKENVNQQTCK